MKFGVVGASGLAARASVVGLALLAAGGVLSALAFHQPSLNKYAVTTTAAVALALAVVSKVPSAIAATLLVVVSPFEAAVFGFDGLDLHFYTLLLIVTVLVVLVEREGLLSVTRRGAAWPVVVALALLVPSFGTAREVLEPILLVALLVMVAWVVANVCALYSWGRLLMAGAFVVMGVFQAALALYERLSGHQLNLYGGGTPVYSKAYFFDYGSAARTPGAFDDPIALGNVLAMVLVVAFGLVFVADDRRARRTLLMLPAIALVAAGIVTSLSRASLLAAALGSIMVALTSRGRRRIEALSAGVLIIAVSAIIATSLLGSTFTSRIDSIAHPTASATRSAREDLQREQIWRIDLDGWHSAPLVGLGFDKASRFIDGELPSSGVQTNPQSTYLASLMETGLLGAAGLALLIAAAGAVIVKARRRGDRFSPILAGVGTALLAAWTTDVVSLELPVAACIAVMIGIVIDLHHRGRDVPTVPSRVGERTRRRGIGGVPTS